MAVCALVMAALLHDLRGGRDARCDDLGDPDLLARCAQPEVLELHDDGRHAIALRQHRDDGVHRVRVRRRHQGIGLLDQGLLQELWVRSIAFEDEGIRLTGIGVGREFNDDVLDKLTEKGKGAYVYMGSEAVVDLRFEGRIIVQPSPQGTQRRGDSG